MEYQVRLSAQAAIDADEAYARIVEYAPKTAARWNIKLFQAIDSLQSFPQRCSLAPESDAFQQEIRQIFHGKRRQKYRILFTIHGDTVRILRILHGAKQSLKPDEN